jgi:hypothetical protein
MHPTPGAPAIFIDWTDGGDAIMVYTYNVDRDTFESCTHCLDSRAEQDGAFIYVVEPCPFYSDDPRADEWYDGMHADIEAAGDTMGVSVCVG